MKGPVWYHVDANSAFLSWEAAYRVHIRGEDLDIRTVPSVIGGSEQDRHGIVLAKSVPAKAYGIQTGESLVFARKKCPGLLVIPPDYELFVRCAKGLAALLGKYCDRIHSYSIDEAFCDMSGSEGLLGNPVVFAEELREEIKETLGFTVNIGISSNKLLAKMASDFKKPDRVHTLFPEEIETKMWPLHAPLRQMGVFTDKLSFGESFQYQLFDHGGHEKLAALDRAVDEIRGRYGENAVMRAAFLGSPIPHMAGGIDQAKRTGMTKGIPY